MSVHLLDALLALGEAGDGQLAALPDTGDLEADLKLVLRATVDEVNQPRYDEPMRALSTEVLHDPALAAAYAERLDGPLKHLKKERLRSTQRSGELADDLDLDLAIELVWGPLRIRWLDRSGPLTAAYADTLVETALNGLRLR